MKSRYGKFKVGDLVKIVKDVSILKKSDYEKLKHIKDELLVITGRKKYFGVYFHTCKYYDSGEVVSVCENNVKDVVEFSYETLEPCDTNYYSKVKFIKFLHIDVDFIDMLFKNKDLILHLSNYDKLEKEEMTTIELTFNNKANLTKVDCIYGNYSESINNYHIVNYQKLREIEKYQNEKSSETVEFIKNKLLSLPHTNLIDQHEYLNTQGEYREKLLVSDGAVKHKLASRKSKPKYVYKELKITLEKYNGKFVIADTKIIVSDKCSEYHVFDANEITSDENEFMYFILTTDLLMK